MSGKRQWPELVGEPADEAVETIKSENPGLKVQKLSENAPTTRDIRHDRVRVFHDESGNVSKVPQTG